VNRRALVVFVLAAACHRDTGTSTDTVPRASGSIRIDGEWDEDDWARRAVRAPLRSENGELARPSSEARFLRDDHDLLVALYAADQNVESRDAFDLTLGELTVHVTATGKVTPALPGVRAKVGMDEGTIDDARDDDEEWVVELAIPLELAGLRLPARVPVRVTRCDVPKDGVRRCGAWSGTLAGG
jgi:hypothetical protein